MSIKNRKKVEDYIIKYINKIGGETNVAIYKKAFKGMNDIKFNSLMIRLRDDMSILPIYAANFSDVKLDVDKNIKICNELGLKLSQKVWLRSDDGVTEYLSPQEFIVYQLPCRRTSQSLLKGIRAPEDNSKRDPLTGQVTGKSQATKLSYPAAALMNGLGLEHSLEELMVTRGGDLGASNAMNAYLFKYGEVSHKDIEQFSTGRESTSTLKAFFKAAHISLIK